MGENFYIITGGPGGGKTTVIEALRKMGFVCVEEGARSIIQQQMRSGGDAVPWNNIAVYRELLLEHALASYRQAVIQSDFVTFFDRSIFDLIAYERRTKSERSEELHEAVRMLSYNKKVFVTPPWEEIFCNDNERKQTFEEAITVYQGIVKVYAEYGFELLELPKTTVEDRVDFIMKNIGNNCHA